MIYLKYLKYLLRHKWYVMIECFKEGLYYRGIMHDMSKFRLSEFIPYARYFYDYDSDRHFDVDLERAFNLAWLKHQKRNPHHWQYWILQEDDGGRCHIKMPIDYLEEMICDWIGAGKAQGYYSPKEDKYKETREWYIKNKENIHVNRMTEFKIRIILGVDK